MFVLAFVARLVLCALLGSCQARVSASTDDHGSRTPTPAPPASSEPPVERPVPQLFGRSVASIPDPDRAGVFDVVVSDRIDVVDGQSVGTVWVLDSARRNVLFAVHGDENGANFGWRVSGFGPPRSNTRGTFLVSALGDESHRGQVRVYSLATRSLVRALTSPASHDQFGFCVDAACDVDGDGVPDIVIGAPCIWHAAPRFGSVYVYSGANGTLLNLIVDDEPDACSGSTVAAWRDEKGPAIAVGQARGDGEIVVRGALDGAVRFRVASRGRFRNGLGCVVVESAGRKLLAVGRPGLGTIELFDCLSGERVRVVDTLLPTSAWALAALGDPLDERRTLLFIGDDEGGGFDQGSVRLFSIPDLEPVFEYTSPVESATTWRLGTSATWIRAPDGSEAQSVLVVGSGHEFEKSPGGLWYFDVARGAVLRSLTREQLVTR